jgi:predicted negative regulator of RcsB-dependent stress response
MIATVKGDIFNARGDSKQAKKQYAIASKALTDIGAKDPLLAMKQAQFNVSTLPATSAAPQNKVK